MNRLSDWLHARRMATLIAVSLLVAACLPQGVKVPQNPIAVALARKSGKIVYLGVDGNVYTMDQTGGADNQITTDATLTGTGSHRYYDFPAWSPDGKKIAFVEINIDGTNQTGALFTSNVDGGDLVEAFNDPTQVPFYLYWSPDSTKVSFLASSAGRQDFLLQLVPAGGGDVQTLDAGQPYYWHWSPNGAEILVHVGGSAVNAGARLSVLGLTNGVSENGLDARPASFQAPAWSPDGSQALLAVTDDQGLALIVTDQTGAEQTRLATLDGGVAFGWSPDGKHVAYISGAASALGMLGKLTIVDPGDPSKSVTLEQDQVIAFFWSPNSKQLAYFVPEIISPTPDPNQDPSQSGQVLVLHLFLTDPGGKAKQIATFVPTRDFYSLLPYFDQYQHSTTIWSPDSQNLVLSAFTSSNGQPQQGVFVVHNSGNLQPRFLKEGTLGLWSPK